MLLGHGSKTHMTVSGFISMVVNGDLDIGKAPPSVETRKIYFHVLG